MPSEMTINYVFGGDYTQDIYSETEMAEALGMTTADLRATLDEDLYGPIPEPDRCIYSYHGHPLSNGGEEAGTFLFNRKSYQDNLLRNNVRTWLIKQNIWTKADGYACSRWLASQRTQLDELTEETAKAAVTGFIAAWNKKDLAYHETIKGYWEHQPILRKIWNASGYLVGMKSSQTDDGITFFGPDEPREGTYIPWQWLRLSKMLGFYNALDFPREKPTFLPVVVGWRPFADQHLVPGNMVQIRSFIYDRWQTFTGMVVKTDSQTVWITENGRHLIESDRSEITAWA